MLAVVFRGDDGLRVEEVREPAPQADQALVAVRASSVNFHEMAFMAGRRRPGFVPGNDVAGTVLEPAANGAGPAAGARVLGFAREGGWAEVAAVDAANLAELPDGVAWTDAAAVPAAGVTALRAVRKLGPVLGRRVLVTGASGGVGRFAVQLATLSGAHVTAVSRSTSGLGALGATEVVSQLDDVAPVAGVIDNVGGPLLAEAFGLLERDGLLLAVGVASGQPTTLDLEPQRNRTSGTRIEAFAAAGVTPYGEDLATLASLLAEGRLDAQVGWSGPLDQINEAISALRERKVDGKAVILVGRD